MVRVPAGPPADCVTSDRTLLGSQSTHLYSGVNKSLYPPARQLVEQCPAHAKHMEISATAMTSDCSVHQTTRGVLLQPVFLEAPNPLFWAQQPPLPPRSSSLLVGPRKISRFHFL